MIFGKGKLIAEQAKELEELRQKLAGMEQELNSYKEKEAAIARTMTDAALTAQNMVVKAETESAELKSAAEKAAGELRETAQKEVDELRERSSTIISDAEKKGGEIIEAAEAESEKKRKETEEEVRSYAGILQKLNENMKEQARLAEEASKKYAAFYEQMSKAMPGLLSNAAPAMIGSAKETEEKAGDVITVSGLTGGEAEGTATTDDILNAL